MNLIMNRKSNYVGKYLKENKLRKNVIEKSDTLNVRMLSLNF